MRIYARVDKSLRRVRIEKETEELGMVSVELKEAKRIWSDGDVSDCNLTFQRLASYDFDIDKLLAFYKEQRELEAQSD